MTAALPAMGLMVVLLMAAALAAIADSRWAVMATAALCGIGALVALAYLANGAPPATLSVPLGLPGGSMALALDGLSGFFLLLLALAGTAAAVATLDAKAEASAPFLPLFLAAMALTLLAADAFTLVAGFELMSLASFALVLTHHADETVRSAALLYLGIAILGVACLIPALALLSGSGLDFAAMRAHPPEGWRADAVFLLVLVGAGAKAGLAPLHVWLPPAHAAAPAPVSALMSGAMTKIAIYVMIRVFFDLCGPGQPMWWGVPLLLLGAAGAVLGALRANVEGDTKSILACSTVENIGLIAIGLGVALAARAVDLGTLAALAMGAALLHALAHAMFKSLLFLGAGAALHGAGTRRLDCLGGLIHRMPVTTACMLLGGACLAALPPSSGFASEWTLFQAILAAPRIGGLGLQILVCVVAALMALAAALAAAAAVRLIGVAFLGRPRTPRAAAAEEAGLPARGAMIGLAALTGAIGLFPGVVLQLAGPALRQMVGLGVARADAGLIAPQTDAPGYAAWGIALLLLAAGGLIVLGLRRHAVAGHRREAAWDCGFAPPPAWLPFGDPVTQYAGASFAQPLRRALGGAILAARETVFMPEPGDPGPARLTVFWRDPAQLWLFTPIGRARDGISALADHMQFLTIRRILAVMFAALVAFLTIVAVAEQL